MSKRWSREHPSFLYEYYRAQIISPGLKNCCYFGFKFSLGDIWYQNKKKN